MVGATSHGLPADTSGELALHFFMHTDISAYYHPIERVDIELEVKLPAAEGSNSIAWRHVAAFICRNSSFIVAVH